MRQFLSYDVLVRVQLIQLQTLASIAPHLMPLNISNPNQIDYGTKLRTRPILYASLHHINDLKQRLIDTWAHIIENIDEAVDQRIKQLSVYIELEGERHHSEQQLT